MDGQANERLASMPVGPRARDKFASTYITIHRSDLIDLLWAKAGEEARIELTTGFNIATCTASTDGVTLTSTDGDSFETPLLIGADGIWSKVREALFAAGQLRYSGKSAYRTLLARSDISDERRFRNTRIWLAPNVHLVHYPVKAGKLLNVVVIADEANGEADWSHPADADQVLRHFSGWSDEITDLLKSAPGWTRS